MSYNCFVIDPPWMERGGGKSKRGADRHYPLVPTMQMPELIKSSKKWVPDDHSLMWMWATNTFFHDACWLIRELGFTRCSGLVWVKPSPGLGQWVRMQHEHLILARLGNCPVPAPEHRCPSVIHADRGAHSEKPEEAWNVIETTTKGSLGVIHGVEFFARKKRDGWDAWGNEC